LPVKAATQAFVATPPSQRDLGLADAPLSFLWLDEPRDPAAPGGHAVLPLLNPRAEVDLFFQNFGEVWQELSARGFWLHSGGRSRKL
jgi:hypothetical protein